MRNTLPRWRGFNLLEMFSPGSRERFREEDFRWISGWGFDFVRLPLCYTLWTKGSDPFQIDAEGEAMSRLDEAVEMAGRHGLHVCLNLHRAPGYCVARQPREPFVLWRSAAALDAFCRHWSFLASRYRGVAADRLSFDLLNEPPRPGLFSGFTRARHERVIRAAVAAVRGVDPTRLLIVDGLNYGRQPCPELAGLPRVAQSCRAYDPFELTHYQAHWMPRGGRWREPEWPLRRDLFGRRWSRARLEKRYAPWRALIDRGVGVHCGEAGCFQRTPPAVFLRWFAEVLAVLRGHGIGWALWNFRGPFGVLDSGRADVAYGDWHGHRLDASLLALLRSS